MTTHKPLATENWEYYRDLYRTCSNNTNYIETINLYYSRIEILDRTLLSNQIKNTDLLISNNFTNIETLFKHNKLITSRLGCIENKFIINSFFNQSIPGDFRYFTDKDDDSLMRSHAGLYYRDIKDKNLVRTWWINNAIELLTNINTTIVSCYLVLAYDLHCLSLLDVKNKFIDSYTVQTDLIRQFNNRNILVVSGGVEDMKKSYDMGMQRLYKPDIGNFNIDFLECPQTTINMSYPHENMINTTEILIDTIDTKYQECDTVLFCCGAYATPLINILSKKYTNKNLLYMGSELYTMFGLYSHGIQMPVYRKHLFNLNQFSAIESECPNQCKHIDGGKYWKI
jgi:hypothetical protein